MLVVNDFPLDISEVISSAVRLTDQYGKQNASEILLNYAKGRIEDIGPILRLVTSPDTDLKIAVAFILGLHRYDQVDGVLLRLLNDLNPSIRMAATWALQLYPSEMVKKELLSVQQLDTDMRVQQYAYQSLKIIEEAENMQVS